jgi:hypothetical protein
LKKRRQVKWSVGKVGYLTFESLGLLKKTATSTIGSVRRSLIETIIILAKQIKLQTWYYLGKRPILNETYNRRSIKLKPILKKINKYIKWVDSKKGSGTFSLWEEIFQILSWGSKLRESDC